MFVRFFGFLKRAILTGVIFSLLFLFSCSMVSERSHEVLAYNPFMANIFYVDVDSSEIRHLHEDDQWIQYPLDFESGLFVDGHSENNIFSLVQTTDSSIKILATFPQGEAVFPVGKRDNSIYLIHYSYDESGEAPADKRHIAEYNLETKQFQDFEFTNGLITYGTVAGDVLYYSVYDEERDLYSIMSISINQPMQHQEPQIVATDLLQGELFSYQGKVFYPQNESIEIEGTEYNLLSENYFIYNHLVQLGSNDNGDLALSVTALGSEKTDLYNSVIGFYISEKQLHVLTEDGNQVYDFSD